jgi:hypothetical protein
MTRFRDFYVDKTLWIKEIMSNNQKVIAVSRPQKFGKSLNISMAKKFLDQSEKNSENVFQGTSIMKEDEIFIESHMNKHPVISIKIPRSL